MAEEAVPVSLSALPDEVLLHILWYLDIPELLAISRTSHHSRALALDPLLHYHRLRYYSSTLALSLSHRPSLHSLQPPSSAIYLTRTHLAARRLHWSLVCIRLNRSLSRRPALKMLVHANIVPKECCQRDRASGEILVAGADRGGLIVERKRKVEREQVKEGLRVWLERKAGEIKKRKKDGGVGVLVWRFSKRAKGVDGAVLRGERRVHEGLEQGRVMGLRRFWEGMGSSVHVGARQSVI